MTGVSYLPECMDTPVPVRLRIYYLQNTSRGSYNKHRFSTPQKTRVIDPVLVQYWASVVDDGPTLLVPILDKAISRVEAQLPIDYRHVGVILICRHYYLVAVSSGRDKELKMFLYHVHVKPTRLPSKHDTLKQWWFNGGPASQTVAQH